MPVLALAGGCQQLGRYQDALHLYLQSCMWMCMWVCCQQGVLHSYLQVRLFGHVRACACEVQAGVSTAVRRGVLCCCFCLIYGLDVLLCFAAVSA